jgi:hypothetical protein
MLDLQRACVVPEPRCDKVLIVSCLTARLGLHKRHIGNVREV